MSQDSAKALALYGTKSSSFFVWWGSLSYSILALLSTAPSLEIISHLNKLSYFHCSFLMDIRTWDHFGSTIGNLRGSEIRESHTKCVQRSFAMCVLCRHEGATITVLTDLGRMSIKMPVSRSKGIGAKVRKSSWLWGPGRHSDLKSRLWKQTAMDLAEPQWPFESLSCSVWCYTLWSEEPPCKMPETQCGCNE